MQDGARGKPGLAGPGKLEQGLRQGIPALSLVGVRRAVAQDLVSAAIEVRDLRQSRWKGS